MDSIGNSFWWCIQYARVCYCKGPVRARLASLLWWCYIHYYIFASERRRSVLQSKRESVLDARAVHIMQIFTSRCVVKSFVPFPRSLMLSCNHTHTLARRFLPDTLAKNALQSLDPSPAYVYLFSLVSREIAAYKRFYDLFEILPSTQSCIYVPTKENIYEKAIFSRVNWVKYKDRQILKPK